MISGIKQRVSSFFSLFQERPAYTVALATGMSALLVGISLYLFVFAGRSLLPTPLASDAPVTPHTTSVPVQIVALGQPEVQPPNSAPQEEPVFEQQAETAAPIVVATTAVSTPAEGEEVVTTAVKNPDVEKSDSEDRHVSVSSAVSSDNHKSDRRWYSQKKKKDD